MSFGVVNNNQKQNNFKPCQPVLYKEVAKACEFSAKNDALAVIADKDSVIVIHLIFKVVLLYTLTKRLQGIIFSL